MASPSEARAWARTFAAWNEPRDEDRAREAWARNFAEDWNARLLALVDAEWLARRRARSVPRARGIVRR